MEKLIKRCTVFIAFLNIVLFQAIVQHLLIIQHIPITNDQEIAYGGMIIATIIAGLLVFVTEIKPKGDK